MITKVEHTEPDYKNFFIINWNLGNTCNFKCSYCPDLLHKGDVSFPNPVLILATVKHIQSQLKASQKIYIEFTGGEVTLHPELIKIASSLKKMGLFVGIISNGSKSSNYWEELAKHVDHVCLSFHQEFNNLNRFKQVISSIQDLTSLHINIMADKDKVQKSIENLDNIYKSFPLLSYELQPILEDINGENILTGYSPEETKLLASFNHKQIISDSNNKNIFSTRGKMTLTDRMNNIDILSAAQIVSKGLNKFQGLNCDAGLESIVIDYRGYIYRSKCNIGGPIGHIMKRPLTLPKKPILCSKQTCSCNFDITTTKRVV